MANKKSSRLTYDSRLRPMLIKEIIYENTDNDHWITSGEITNILEELYGLTVSRQTLYSDIEKLIAAGYDIICDRDIQNKYKVASRDFDIAEIKMLIDNIEASKSLSYTRTKSLAKRLAGLAGPRAAEFLLESSCVDARNKTDNNQVCYIVEIVYEAITKHHQIKFAYSEYIANKVKVTKHDGKEYVDFTSGIGVNCLGYCDDGWVKAVSEQVATFAMSAVAKLRKQGSLAQEITVFAMTNRFKDDAPQTSGGVCMPFPDATADHRTVVLAAVEGCRRLFRPGFGYKKAGVVFTRIVQAADHTRSLFEDQAAAGKEARLSETLDTITRTFGPGAVLFGAQGDGTIRNAREHQSPHYTTLWSDIPGVKVE